KRLLPVAMLLAGLLVAVSPWMIRNWIEMGEPLLFPTKGALNLWMRNHPEVLEMEGLGTAGESVSTLRRADLLEYPDFEDAPGEIERSRQIQGRALGFIAANPVYFARLSLDRFLAFMSPAGTTAGGFASRAIGYALYVPILLIAVWQVVRNARDPAVVLLAVVFLAYAALHALAHGGVRYRLPVDGCLIMLAATLLATRRKEAAA
ncbi:hypothetical protein JW921_00290, partial [Candidatus Fermentibacterales bacterium]|nr:hypothetical protein [Candidatus Fermentibacterales bacterium]